MTGHSNGVWIWELPKIRSDYLDQLVKQQVKRVYLKVFDGHFQGKLQPTFWNWQCSPDIIEKLKSRGIEVYGWGYHYGTSDVAEQIQKVKQALDCGIDGYVLDLEAEVEDKSTHIYVEKLLVALRPLVKEGTLGYTSFGHPQFHPHVPWQILDEHCDLALPQIYFEKFSFKSTNEEEVQDCLKAYEQMGLKKPILPIFGSESDAKQPASGKELQSYLNRFPGSSIWRLPNSGEQGEAWNLTYAGETPVPIGGEPSEFTLPKLTRILRTGVIGEDVKALQKVLNAKGFNAGKVDGEFGPDTEAAVRAFQKKTDITVDGEVGPQTWKELGGESGSIPEQGFLGKLAGFAEDEAAKGLSWNGVNSEAEKYLKLFREPMLTLGHIGSSPVFYDWCAAFVTYCCRNVGAEIPDIPEGFWASMALVESWKYWAKKKGYWNPKGSVTPRRGDILVFDWEGDSTLNHIGIVRGYTPENSVIQTSEGNKSNKSGNFTRSMATVAGFIRIS
ncbi:peptidoglycan-binding protein [Nostoc sp. FACHB-133]|uniref:peptidoglycan-binding protein n=1 Tax=Nostoc sp. FACHB-133 TaxID=2692835 RepID=UPI0016896ACD|nr:peptidoglycan-binding protein [Nostoc sp. FACHB-133]MBD2526664.1 peptidoglycan-binding protein [Nostoc sp. FACHB-133]